MYDQLQLLPGLRFCDFSEETLVVIVVSVTTSSMSGTRPRERRGKNWGLMSCKVTHIHTYLRTNIPWNHSPLGVPPSRTCLLRTQSHPRLTRRQTGPCICVHECLTFYEVLQHTACQPTKLSKHFDLSFSTRDFGSSTEIRFLKRRSLGTRALRRFVTQFST